MHSERPKHRMYEQWHPLGVVGIISAFNFPGRRVVVECVPRRRSAATSRVWKPSPKTPLCAVAVQHICNRVLRAARTAARSSSCSSTAAPSSRRASSTTGASTLVSFTGSTAVGRDVGERVAARLGKSLLELGGNNAIIVDEFANLDLAVPADRVRRGRHGRPALHDDASRARARIAARRSSSSDSSTPTRRCASAIRSSPAR